MLLGAAIVVMADRVTSSLMVWSLLVVSSCLVTTFLVHRYDARAK
jgi:hypothetical protein